MKWFVHEESGTEEALALRTDFERGDIEVVVPHLLFAEILNTTGRRQRWSADALDALATTLDAMPFRIVDPAPPRIARWVGERLTAYDATYVALAEETGRRVVTTDAQMLDVAPALTAPLA